MRTTIKHWRNQITLRGSEKFLETLIHHSGIRVFSCPFVVEMPEPGQGAGHFRSLARMTCCQSCLFVLSKQVMVITRSAGGPEIATLQ